MIRRIISFLRMSIFCAILWIVLTERYSVTNAIVGGLIGILLIQFVDRVLVKGAYLNEFEVSFIRLALYFAFLFVIVYKSAFEVMIRILFNKDKTCVTEYHTDLTNPFYICLLANAITLTPGTVSLNMDGNILTILSFADNAGNSILDLKTLKYLEKLLLYSFKRRS